MEVLSVRKALDILFWLEKNGAAGVTEISQGLGINKSTVYRILYTFRQDGLVVQNPDTEKYALGLRLYSLGLAARAGFHIVDYAKPLLRKLSDDIGEYIHLSIMSQKQSEFPESTLVAQIVTRTPLALAPSLSSETVCHATAMGKCLLAFGDPKLLDAYPGRTLPAFTDRTITTWEALANRLQQIRQDGYCIEEGEVEQGLACVAFPIFGRSGKAIAAFSASGSESRILAKKDKLIAAMKSVSEALSYKF